LETLALELRCVGYNGGWLEVQSVAGSGRSCSWRLISLLLCMLLLTEALVGQSLSKDKLVSLNELGLVCGFRLLIQKTEGHDPWQMDELLGSRVSQAEA